LKKIILFIVVVVCSLSAFSCGKSEHNITSDGVSYDIPTSWTSMDSSHDIYYYGDFDDESGALTYTFDLLQSNDAVSEKLDKEVKNIYSNKYLSSEVTEKDIDVAGYLGKSYSYYSLYCEEEDAPFTNGNIEYHIDTYIVHDKKLYRFVLRAMSEMDADRKTVESETSDAIKKILKTVKFE